MTCDRSVVFSGYSGSSTNKTDRHGITEILLKHHKPNQPILLTVTVSYLIFNALFLFLQSDESDVMDVATSSAGLNLVNPHSLSNTAHHNIVNPHSQSNSANHDIANPHSQSNTSKHDIVHPHSQSNRTSDNFVSPHSQSNTTHHNIVNPQSQTRTASQNLVNPQSQAKTASQNLFNSQWVQTNTGSPNSVDKQSQDTTETKNKQVPLLCIYISGLSIRDSTRYVYLPIMVFGTSPDFKECYGIFYLVVKYVCQI